MVASEKAKWRKKNCSPDYPNLSVGDVNLTVSNFDKFKKDNEVFILGISDSQCEHCCYTEGMLNGIHTGLQTKAHTYGKVSDESELISLARVSV